MRNDWHPDAKLRPIVVNIQLAEGGELLHAGIGFSVVTPNGNVIASRGWTWENVPDDHRASLEAACHALAVAAAEDEGLQGGVEYPARLPQPHDVPSRPKGNTPTV